METRETSQLGDRIDAALNAKFSLDCKQRGETRRQILERLIEAHLTAAEMRGQMHLDGTRCPMSTLLDTLADHARNIAEGWLQADTMRRYDAARASLRSDSQPPKHNGA